MADLRAGLVVILDLRNRAGALTAQAVIDDADAPLVEGRRWWLSSHGYVRGSISGEDVYLHRVLLGLRKGDRRHTDHVNGDKLDNRRENLRVCSAMENGQNRRTGRGTSRHRGVSFEQASGRWVAQAIVNGTHHHLGRHATEAQAAKVVSAFRAAHAPFSPDARAA